MTRKPAGLFIAGTDTDVGKTYVGTCIVRALVCAGCRVGVYKPAASGCRTTGDQLVSDDALALWEAAGRPGELARVCPQRFAAPLAPHLAARAEGRTLNDELLVRGLGYWQERSELLVVEGAGGLLSPLSDRLLVADLAAQLGLPLVIVVRDTLGAINQALQAALAASRYGAGQPVAAIVLNQRDDPPDASCATNLQEIVRLARPPLLPAAPRVLCLSRGAEQFVPAVDWRKIAGS